MLKWTALSMLLVAAVMLAPTRAADEKKEAKAFNGYIVDVMCAATMVQQDDPQAAAAKHPKACAMKEACAASGYGLMSEGKFLKFDDSGNKLAKEYLAKDDNTPQVQVMGTKNDDGTLAVTAINAAMEKK